MKKILSAFVMLVLAAGVVLAENDQGKPSSTPQLQSDLSLWVKDTDGVQTPIPWYVGNIGKLYVEARYNFDWLNTSSIFVGRNYGAGSFTVTPTMGLMSGDYEAVSPQVYLSYTKGKFFALTLNQVSWCTKEGLPSFLYHWTTFNWRLNPRIGVGLDEQVYREYASPAAETFIDIGPQAKVYVGPKGEEGTTYVKLWYTRDPYHSDIAKFFAGLGITF